MKRTRKQAHHGAEVTAGPPTTLAVSHADTTLGLFLSEDSIRLESIAPHEKNPLDSFNSELEAEPVLLIREQRVPREEPPHARGRVPQLAAVFVLAVAIGMIGILTLRRSPVLTANDAVVAPEPIAQPSDRVAGAPDQHATRSLPAQVQPDLPGRRTAAVVRPPRVPRPALVRPPNAKTPASRPPSKAMTRNEPAAPRPLSQAPVRPLSPAAPVIAAAVNIRDEVPVAVSTPAPANVVTPPPAIVPSPPRTEDTALARVAAAPAVPTDNGAIQTVLGRYRRAFNILDADLASTVWPSVDARALTRAFDRLAKQELEFDRCHITVNGLRAVADCEGRTRYVPKVGSKSSRTEPLQWKFNLQKVDQNWLIEAVDTR